MKVALYSKLAAVPAVLDDGIDQYLGVSIGATDRYQSMMDNRPGERILTPSNRRREDPDPTNSAALPSHCSGGMGVSFDARLRCTSPAWRCEHAGSAKPKTDVPLETSIPYSEVALESILCTEELHRRHRVRLITKRRTARS
mgnify:CR=1 FL=1